LSLCLVLLGVLILSLLLVEDNTLRAVIRKKNETAALPSVTQSFPGKNRCRALVIGINDYQDPEIRDLGTPLNDARALAAILKDKYGFTVKTLLDREATWNTIKQELDRLVESSSENDSALIYFGGHGVSNDKSDSDEAGWWLPADARKGEIKTYFSNTEIRAAMKAAQARHVLVVSDSCFAASLFGSFRSTEPENRVKDKYYSKLYGVKSCWGLTSGGREPVMDDGADGHSMFAYHFLNLLQNNSQPIFCVQDVHQKLVRNVTNNSDQKPLCLPVIHTGGHLEGQFVFIEKGT
jgi:hypothetical protein